MKIIREASENEMVLSFLKGEINSDRFSADLRAAVKKFGADETIITDGSLDSEEENVLRGRILGEFRGYPDREIFENYPKVSRWVLAEFKKDELGKMRYIDYSYWNELSDHTSTPAAAAVNVTAGIKAFNVPNSRFFKAADSLDREPFPPVILLTCGNDKYLILEGHCRMTAYALRPEKFDGATAYVGYCTEAEMRAKEPKMI